MPPYGRQVYLETPAQLTVVPWIDPVVEAHGHRPGSAYVDMVWRGVLGPAASLCWERLGRLAASRAVSVVDSADLAASLGLGGKLGRNAPLSHAIARMVAFGAAVRVDDSLAVRRALPDVPVYRVARLSRSARLAHQRLAHSAWPASQVAEHTPSLEVTP